MKLRLPLLTLALSLGAGSLSAQIASTDIFVFEVDGGQLGEIRRITDREGYDNQPRFLPGGREVVYSSMRDGQTDIYRHDLKTGEATRVLASEHSEYSPTPIPGTQSI
ncbi:MAG: hypothetical protein GTN89_09595, partial [Acidobacteria bacterium]|nr:hypothetical protein [Acidobacteriota bacterium]NIM61038.1 hypothetical protein [Acidobacteriota bacterium]NIO59586.1 hypothetical protein [Acidobacteriota bacterium]NIQ30606.1 hypothetical protein [Acidobacteriota bacterium]NIQ84313.1 hypothetical protein [Acidobacteriota bacterium]